MRPLLPYIFISLLLPVLSTAQEERPFCITPAEMTPWLMAYQQNPAAFPRSPGLLYVPLAVHILGNEKGEGFLPYPELLELLCSLNEKYEPAGIQFFLSDEPHYIDEPQYFEHTYLEGINMMQDFNVDKAINCYFVGDAAGSCGYAIYSLGLALSKDCFDEHPQLWAHEMGHFFSLPHTFHGWENYNHNYSLPAPATVNGREVEQADGSNCQLAGDGFCDTPADYLNSCWPCQPGGSLSQQLQADPSGRAFRSDGSLLMSYAKGPCATRFSGQQLEAIRANLESQRPQLVHVEPPVTSIDQEKVFPVRPLPGALVTDVSSLTLEWEAVPNAEGYLIALSILRAGNQENLFSVYRSTKNRIELTGLSSDRSWLWRVKPYNRAFSCVPFSDAFEFSTGNFINTTRELSAFSDFFIQPNPAPRGSLLQLSFNAPVAMRLRASLYKPTGQLVWQQPATAHFGHNLLELSTEKLPPGVYWLGIENEQGRKFRKLIVQ